MKDFNSALFWYKPVFMVGLLISELIFMSRLEKRSYFFFRLFIAIKLSLIAAFLFPIIFYNEYWGSLMFVVLFSITVFLMKFCFAESMWNILFCAIAAFTVQHIAYTLWITIVNFFDIGSFLFGESNLNPYIEDSLNNLNPFVIIAYIDIYFVVYWASYYIFADHIRSQEETPLGSKEIIVLSTFILLADVVFNMITTYNVGINDKALYLERIYNLLICLLILYLQFNLYLMKFVNARYETMSHILETEREQYFVTRETIEIVNQKCHDLKHQIRQLRRGRDVIDKAELKNIENAVEIYETIVKTGNNALDVILMEKSLFCEKNGIRFDIIADGSKLAFMQDCDIYALFGNAIDNAMTAVSKLEQSKRFISLQIKQIGSMVSVHMENCFEGELRVKNGIPQTTQSDKINHGFGMRSIRAITEKYNGIFAVEVDQQLFGLNLLFPLPVTNCVNKATDCASDLEKDYQK